MTAPCRATARPGVVLLLLLLVAVSSPAWGKNALEQRVAELNKDFKERRFTTKLPVPAGITWRHRFELAPDGRIDLARFQKMMNARSVGLGAGYEGRRLYFKLKPDRHLLLVSLMGKRFPKSVAAIAYGRPITVADLSREAVMGALSTVVDVEGLAPVAPPSGFDPEALLALLDLPEEAFDSSYSGEVSEPGSAVGEADPAPVPSVDSPVATAPPRVLEPRLIVLSAEVEPVRVRVGDEIDILVHFAVEDLPPGRAVPVALEWQLFVGEEALLPAPVTNTFDRGVGRHTMEETFVVPAGAPPGVYRLRAVLRGVGGEHIEEALFEVRATVE